MSDNTGEPHVDPWAWLHEEPNADTPDWDRFPVTAFVVATCGEPGTSRCRDAAADGRVAPERIVTLDGAPDADEDADWLWVLPDSCEPTPDALAELLARVHAEPDCDVVGPLLIEPRRRGPGIVIAGGGQTMSRSGRIQSLVEAGELYQGQLETTAALGVPASGMLVRGEAWRSLGGFTSGLPESHWGIDFGWRANLAGRKVVSEPKALVVTRADAEDPALARAAGLALAAAHARTRRLAGLRLVLGTLLAAFGFTLGKDLQRAGAELRGLRLWLRGGPARRAAESAVDSLSPSPSALAATKALLPARGTAVRRGADAVAGRLAEWLESFTEREETTGLDELTGDDFAGQGRSVPRVPAVLAGIATMLVLALVAGRGAFGEGSLWAVQLLPAPDSWADLAGDYLAPVPGAAGLSGAPWQGILGLASLAAFGRPDWLVTLVLLGCVPLAWLASFRLLRQLLDDVRPAAVGATAYSLAPALAGALNLGSFGVAAWTLLLPVAGYSLWWWHGHGRGQWRAAGAVALWLTLACALVPAAWPPALAAALVAGVRGRSTRLWAQLGLVVASPLLLLVGPWSGTLLRYPGRLFTGIEPSLAPITEPDPWRLVIAGTGGPAGPPEWISMVVLGVLWVAAIAGAARRPGVASYALASAGGAVVTGIVLTRMVVWVPPGEWARPAAVEWQVLMVGGLVLAACLGLDQMGAELRERALGFRHLATLGLALSAAAAVTLAGVWWVLAGQAGLSRDPVGAVPPFVRNAQVSATPGRTLALEVREGRVGWALIQDDFPRLGDVERGLIVSGDTQARARVTSVVTRLVIGSADEQIVADLVSLGVAHIWLWGGDADLRMAISNAPGLGIGTGDATQTVWPVPDSGRTILESGTERMVTGTGLDVPAGEPDRRLILAEPADTRWSAELAATSLAPVEFTDGRQAFSQASGAGVLVVGLAATSPWWAWAQVAGLLFLLVLAAPGLRRPAEGAAPRRAAGGAS